MPDLSVVIITNNEEANLRRCLDSVRFADEIVIVDSGSGDRTLEIATSFGARIYEHPWDGFGRSKQKAVSYATGNWILSLDADEVLSEILAEEIKGIMKSDSSRDGYYLNRRTNFLGRWIGHSGWYPDSVLRLFRKGKGRFDDAVIHEKVILDGPAGILKGELYHYSYTSLEQYIRKSNRYTTLGAEEVFSRGRKASLWDITARPFMTFIKHFLIKQGFRDGWEGFLISCFSAHAVAVKYAKLRYLWRCREKRVK